MTLQAVFVFERDTQNTRRFAEVPAGDPFIAKTVYLQQEALRAAFGKLPERIRVVVEALEP